MVLSGIRNKVRQGYGGAIKCGIAAAKTDYIVTIDADGQHLMDDVQTLFEEICATDADMIVGGRTNIEGEGWYRKLGKILIRGIAKALMPLNVHDINSGMKVYNTELARRYSELCPDSMAYSNVITLAFINQKHLVLERPIRILPRTHGTSTIDTMTALDTVRQILNIVVLFNPILNIYQPLWGE